MTQPNAPYPQPSPYPQQVYEPTGFIATTEPKKKRRGPLVTVAVVAGVLVVTVGAALILRGTGTVPVGVPLVGKDTGIAACEGMRDGATDAKPKVKGEGDDKKMTAEEYQNLRKLFTDSRHEDIRTAGTKFADVVWQAVQLTDGSDNGLALLPLAGTLMESFGGVVGACANHGVVIENNK